MSKARSYRLAGVVFCLSLLVAAEGRADSVTLVSVRDNTLYEDSLGARSNGAGDNFFAGKTATAFVRRGLLAFDIAASIAEGATIGAVTLTLHLSKRNPFLGGPEIVELHRCLADWGEGTSNAVGEEGSGDFAAPGDATWIHTFFDTDFWPSAGGDFSPVVSASQIVDSVAFYVWSGLGLVADVQSMLEDPANDFGWVVIGNEDTTSTTKRFDTREDTIPSFRPTLEVEFTVPTGIGKGEVPIVIELHPGVPNPFNPATTMRYALGRPGIVTLSIHDGRGRLIRVLTREWKTEGTYSVTWNGRDDRGRAMSSGVYFVRLESSGQIRSRKVVFLK